MFAGEAAGLTAMRLAAEASSEEGAPSLRIPEVLHAADYADGKGSFIIMEFLRMGRGGDAGDFGRAMARARVDLGPMGASTGMRQCSARVSPSSACSVSWLHALNSSSESPCSACDASSP